MDHAAHWINGEWLRSVAPGDSRNLRALVLHAMTDAFDRRAEELALLLAAENGKVLAHARIVTPHSS